MISSKLHEIKLKTCRLNVFWRAGSYHAYSMYILFLEMKFANKQIRVHLNEG